MATKLGGFSTGTMVSKPEIRVPIDESVCGMIFDIATRDNVFSGYSKAKGYFEDNQVQCINNIDEAINLGIAKFGVLSGVPYYHIEQFYNYVGHDAKFYIMFADITNSSIENSPLEIMLTESNCEVFQIGIWTESNIFKKQDDNIVFSDIISNIHAQSQQIKGTSEAPTSYPSAVNVIVCGGLGAGDLHKSDINYKNLPDCTDMNYELLSIIIGECTSTSVLPIANDAQVGMIGLVMGCLATCGAENSIACVKDFNLNRDDTFASAKLGLGSDGTNIANINRIQASILALKGYIFPTTYDSKEGAIYLCSDSTMSMGDYGSISSNRIIDRLRRIMRRALVPMINGRIVFEKRMDTISQASITEIRNNMKDAIDTYMINTEGQSQLSAYEININSYQPKAKDDQIEIEIAFAYLESENVISFIERYNTK